MFSIIHITANNWQYRRPITRKQ